MKTKTNLYLRSLCVEKKSALREAHDEELRKLNDALTALRTEESQKQPTPALSEKTVEAIRHLLEIHLKSANKMSDDVKYFLPFVPVGEERDKIVLDVKAKVDEAATALKEFNTAYPCKSKIGDRFVVISNKSPDCRHHFKIGSVVTLKYIEENGKKSYEADNGLIQIVRDRDVAPYKA